MNSLTETKSAINSSAKKLLHFGVDHIKFNFLNWRDKNSNQLTILLEKLFKPFSKVKTNKRLENYKWINGEFVEIIFKKFKEDKGEVLEFYKEDVHIFSIFKPSDKWIASKIKFDHTYIVDFYGSFFNLERISYLNTKSYIKSFARCVDNDISVDLKRLDICADISGITNIDIEKGLVIKTQREIFFSDIKRSTHKNRQTLYIDENNAKKTIRAYDKKKEIEGNKRIKNKKKYYLDYFEYEKVTRLELELKGEYCKKFKLNLDNIFDLNYLLTVYKENLCTRDYRLKIVTFIKRELKKQGFELIPIEYHKTEINKVLDSSKFVKQFINKAKRMKNVYGLNPIIILLGNNELIQSEFERERIRELIDFYYGKYEEVERKEEDLSFLKSIRPP